VDFLRHLVPCQKTVLHLPLVLSDCMKSALRNILFEMSLLRLSSESCVWKDR
jgi:hypothetical protein